MTSVAPPAAQAMPPAAVALLLRLAVHHADTWRHSLRVGRLAALLAERAGLAGALGPGLAAAASLHDIGKLRVPRLLLDKPDALAPDEQTWFRRHTSDGAALLAKAEGSGLAIAIARHHHERWDGSGYPQGLRGEAIPLAARLVSLVDVYDAIRAPRAYNPAQTHATAMAIMHRIQTEFDPALFQAFAAAADAIRAASEQDATP